MPSNINVTLTGNDVDTIIVSWEPPYTLHGVAILYYNVDVSISYPNTSRTRESMHFNLTGTRKTINLSTNNGDCADFEVYVCVEGVTSAGLGKQGCVIRKDGERQLKFAKILNCHKLR